MREFKDAYKKASEKLKQQREACEALIRLKRGTTLSIKELDAKTKNLIDWHYDVMGQ